jgi:5-hydroxyisourate hydrolase-like protein (transthyretin family)
LPTPPVTVPDADTFVADFNLTTAFLQGVVVDRDTEQPIPGATVGAQSIDPQNKRPQYSAAEANAEGRFRLDVDPGDYEVSANAEGYARERMRMTVGESGASGVRFGLGRGLVIRGRVVDVAGRGMGGITVTAATAEGQVRSSGWGHTLSDGSFEVGGLVDAPYALAAQAQGEMFAFATGISPDPHRVTLTARKGGRVKVKVLGASGAPAAGINVLVSRVQGEPVGGVGFARTDENGRVEMAAPAGTIELTGQGPGGQSSTTVTVPAGGTVSAEIRLAPSASQ